MVPFEVKQTWDGATLVPDPHRSTAEERCRYLERGGIIYFPKSPFTPAEEDRAFLLQQRQLEGPYHKNIGYRPLSDRLTGVDVKDRGDDERLRGIMRRYSEQVTAFLEDFLAPYRDGWRLDYASYRPVEEKGRRIRLRARNDLLHVDAFPTRPVYGHRILRVFTNIHPTRARVWQTSDGFELLVDRFKEQVPLPRKGPLHEPRGSLAAAFARWMGLRWPDRSPYDRWMLSFHHFLKENSHFQSTCPKRRWAFPPGSSWMVFTDAVSHAVVSGQYAVEQTYIIDHGTLLEPERSPLSILEKRIRA